MRMTGMTVRHLAVCEATVVEVWDSVLEDNQGGELIYSVLGRFFLKRIFSWMYGLLCYLVIQLDKDDASFVQIVVNLFQHFQSCCRFRILVLRLRPNKCEKVFSQIRNKLGAHAASADPLGECFLRQNVS